jgi:hypothetical protein
MRLPDPLLVYVLAARPVQDGLQGVLTQFAGFHLMQLTSKGGVRIEPAPIEAARQSLSRWREALRDLRVAGAAAHHYFHIDRAATALEVAAVLGLGGRAKEGEFHQALEQAWTHLRAASRSLPGFERVDLTQACCAAHAPVATARHRTACY